MNHWKPKNIIVRMPNWLGDLVMATPVLTDLRNFWPTAKISAFCQGSLGCVLQNDPHVDEIIQFKRPRGLFSLSEQKKLFNPLKEGQYDLGILLTNSFSSALWFWKGQVKNRLGYRTNLRKWFLDYFPPFPPQKETQHLVITYKMLLQELNIPLSTTKPTLYLTEQEKEEAEKHLRQLNIQKTDLLIGINPGAAFGSAKCWLPERFKELSALLLKHKNVKIIFFGDKLGESLVKEICDGFSNQLINLAGKTSLRELMALIYHCDLFLTNDSGPMHVASALEVPLIALFGSTSDTTTGPYGGGKIIHKRVPCSPCYRRECPIDFRCMTSIEVREVYEAIQKLLQFTRS